LRSNRTQALKQALHALSAATIVAALGVSGCSSHAPESTAASSTTATSAPAPAQTVTLPDAAALIDVLNRLSDPAVAGSDKLPLVEGATGDDAAALDKFAKALQDNHMLPLAFAATELAWSPDVPGNVTANVHATPAAPGAGAFSFPMEFKPVGPAWQLSRKTADLLLAFGANAQDSSTPDPSSPTAPAPAPTPTR
jgi:hypothetical protein